MNKQKHVRHLVVALVMMVLGSFPLFALPAQGAQVATTLVINVRSFGATGDGRTDDSAAFNSALQTLDASGGGTLLVPAGTYLVGDLKVASGTTIQGTSVPRPILVKNSGGGTILDLSGTVVGGSRSGLHDITIKSLRLKGRSLDLGFQEHVHNVVAIGLSNLLIDHVLFEAFQGDGLYLGSRLSPAESPVHNSNVIVTHSTFLGGNAQNRNGISLIDCTRCILEHNTFIDVTRPGMPGPIDIEPNQLDELIQGVIIRDNSIDGTNGTAGIALSLRAGTFLHEPGQIRIEKNTIRHAKVGVFIARQPGGVDDQRQLGLILNQNSIQETSTPFLVDGVSGITIDNNILSDASGPATIGPTFASHVRFTNNRLSRIGGQSACGISLSGRLSLLEFENNTFANLGSRKRNPSSIAFLTSVVSGITFIKNVFSSTDHITHFAVRSASGAKLEGSKINWTGNVLNDGIRLGTLP